MSGDVLVRWMGHTVEAWLVVAANAPRALVIVAGAGEPQIAWHTAWILDMASAVWTR